MRSRLHVAHTDLRHGFALLAVVVCLVLVSLAAVSLTRRSLQVALEAQTAQEELRSCWAVASLERAGTALAIQLYSAAPAVPLRSVGNPRTAVQPPSTPGPVAPRPRNSYPLRVVLSGQTWQLLIADESTKVNLNTVCRLGRREGVRQTALALGALDLHTEQFPVMTTRGGATHLVQAWGDVFWLPPHPQATCDWSDLPQRTAQITLWGDGTLNALRASNETLFELSRLVTSDGKSREWIAEFRKSFPLKRLDRILSETEINASEQAELLAVLGDRSTALSVWVWNESGTIHSCALSTRGRTGGWDLETIRIGQ